MIENVWYTTVYVEDLARAVDFYTGKLGLVLKFANAEEGYASLDTRGAILALSTAGGKAKAKGLAGRETGIALGVRDVAAVYAELCARGVNFQGPPVSHPWGTTAVLVDPDGNTLTLDQIKRE